MDGLVQAMSRTGTSRSKVSRLCEEIGGQIVAVPVTLTVGANADGRLEVLGMAIGAAELFWTEFLRDLVHRAAGGVKRVFSDAHEGITAATVRILSAT